MKGLELSELFFRSCGEDMLKKQFSRLAERAAVGLVGPGSECYRFDDVVSRDHDWGPSFCIWLTLEDFNSHGKRLQAGYENLPQTFMEFGPRQVSPGEEWRVGVIEITQFYRTYTGLDRPPAVLSEWLRIPEQNLSLCTNGKIFYDPLGEFSAWRETLLDFYPEDVRLKKIASRCLTAGQAGQYNVPRSLRRNDLFAFQYGLMKFCSDIISLVFLLNRQYSPYFKWMHRGVKELPVLGESTFRTVQKLISGKDLQDKVNCIEEFCQDIIKSLRGEDLSDLQSDFLLDHASSVHGRIQDNSLVDHLMVVG